MSTKSNTTHWSRFVPLISVFFFWGFVAASNDILIPVFKDAFDLSNFQSQLVAFAFYIAYTVGSLLYMGISKLTGFDILNRIGYKMGLIYGLLFSAAGTLLFIPAANQENFWMMLSALFVVGLGFSLQQTVANPLAILMGPSKTGAQRLTLAGGINNFGTTIGPLLVSFAIFGTVESGNSIPSLSSVKIPYLILGAAFVLVAVVLYFSKLPNQKETIEVEEENIASKTKVRTSALKYPQLILGMIGIFVYVGVEVSTASNLPAYLENSLGFKTNEVAPFVSLYWASLMIGRWSGAVEAFNPRPSLVKPLKLFAPYLAFAVFLLVTWISGHAIEQFYFYGAIILVLIFADLLSKGNPANMLLLFSCIGIVALLIGIFSTGLTSVYAFISVGLFCSTLWPCIFTLAIAGLGKHTNEGSSFLIMMIMGGGFISALQGWIGDIWTIHLSYFVGVACFAYLAFYAVKVKSILQNQGVDINK